MPRCFSTILILTLLCVTRIASAQSPPSPLAIDGLDPLHLCGGKEIQGDPARVVEHQGYRYQFASDETKASFEKEPTRYRIQLSGGCGRMGSLSGRGQPDRFAVHDARLYLFASDGCRTAFQKSPVSFLEHDDPLPTSSPESAARTTAVLERAFSAHGGRAQFAGLRTLRLQRAWKEESQKQVWDRGETLAFQFPSDIREDSNWGEKYHYATAVAKGSGTNLVGAVSEPLFLDAVAEMRRKSQRHLAVVLSSALRPDAKLILVTTKEGPPNGPPVLAIAVDGACTQITLDPVSGEVKSLTYRGRGPSLAYGTVTETLSDFRACHGLRLPFHSEFTIDGKPMKARSWTTIETGVTFPPGHFELN